MISELDLDYRSRYPDVVIPDAYPKLILDAIRGDQQQLRRIQRRRDTRSEHHAHAERDVCHCDS